MNTIEQNLIHSSPKSSCSSMTEHQKEGILDWIRSDYTEESPKSYVRVSSIDQQISPVVLFESQESHQSPITDVKNNVHHKPRQENQDSLLKTPTSNQRHNVIDQQLRGMSPINSLLSAESCIGKPMISETLLENSNNITPISRYPSSPPPPVPLNSNENISKKRVVRTLRPLHASSLSLSSLKSNSSEAASKVDEKGSKLSQPSTFRREITSVFHHKKPLFLEMYERDFEDDDVSVDDMDGSYSTSGCLCRMVTMLIGSITFMGMIGLFWILETSVKEDQYLA